MRHLLRMDPRASVDLFEDEQRRVFRLPETTKTTVRWKTLARFISWHRGNHATLCLTPWWADALGFLNRVSSFEVRECWTQVRGYRGNLTFASHSLNVRRKGRSRFQSGSDTHAMVTVATSRLSLTPWLRGKGRSRFVREWRTRHGYRGNLTLASHSLTVRGKGRSPFKNFKRRNSWFSNWDRLPEADGSVGEWQTRRGYRGNRNEPPAAASTFPLDAPSSALTSKRRPFCQRTEGSCHSVWSRWHDWTFSEVPDYCFHLK